MPSRFRKAFIVCEDNQTFNKMTQVTIYKYRDHAEFACKRAQKQALEQRGQYENEHKPIPRFKVHAFYLVHEDMFRE
jgi:hypothetical protein